MSISSVLSVARPVLRVASVPSGHPYVQHLTTDGGDPAVVRLADPTPEGAPAGQWWPPVILDGDWIRAHADDVDLVHVHFGTESFSLDHLRGVVEALREAGLPLVYTVHDLTNPQLVDQAPHEAQVALLVAEADALVTLTPGAASEVEARWGRRPEVVPHPNILPLDASAPTGTPVAPLVVGVHLRDLRPNIDAVRSVATLLAAVELLNARGVEAVARVDVNDRVRDQEARDRVTALVADAPSAELRAHPRLSDAALAASLADLDVAVLPYRHGTHSGWVELCFDLGVPVAGPRVGFVAEQHPSDFAAFDAGDPESMAEALLEASRRGTRPGTRERLETIASRRVERRRQRVDVETAHRDLYRRARAGA